MKLFSIITTYVVLHCSFALFAQTVEPVQEPALPVSSVDMSHLKKGSHAIIPSSLNNINIGYFEDLALAYQYKEQVKHLNLQNQNLGILPDKVLEFSQLEILDISNNQINSLPNELANLKNIKEVFINKNNFGEFPLVITQLSGLKVLNVGYNPINVLPKEITNLTVLEKLVIEAMPPSFVLNPEIGQLSQLKELYILASYVTELPFDFLNLKNLEVLCLNNNQLQLLDASVYTLSNLNYLSFGQNKISQISPAISHLKQLTYLGIFDNPINDLPQEVYKLAQLEEFSCWKINIDFEKISNPTMFKNKKIELHNNIADAR